MGIKILEADLKVAGKISEHGSLLQDRYVTKVAYNSPSSSVGAPFSLQSFIGSTRAMRLFGLPADQIIVEQSTDGGQTWESADASDWTKQHLFLQTRSASIKIPLKNGKKSCDCMLRVTITGMKYNVPENTPETEKYNYWNQNYATSNERYCSLSFGYIWLNANYDRIYIEHQHATGAYPDSWNKDGVLNEALGWTGGNCIAFEDSGTFGGDVTQVYNKWNHRFIFRTQAKDGSFNDNKLDAEGLTTQQSIIEISAYGEACWQAANEMMKTDRPYYINETGAVVFDQSTMYVNGIVSASNYVHGVNGVYSDSSVYATSGFVFRGQADADKKLLTADGWWKHIDTFATADAVSSLEENTKIMNTSSKTPQVGDIIHANTLLDSINSLTDSGASFSLTYYVVNAKTNTGNGKIYWYDGAWYFDWYDDSDSQYLKNEMIVIPIDVRVVSIDYVTEPDPACEIIVFENYQLTAQQAYNMTNEKLNKSPKIVGYLECDNGNFIASGSVWPYAGLINKMCCIKAIYIPKEEYIGATTTIITNIDTEHFGIEYWEPGEDIRGTIWISMCQYDDGGIQIAIGGNGNLDINNVAFEIYTL